jgi:uncharacterized protein (DUF952 family)
MEKIYHVTTRTEWEKSRETGFYEAPSLKSEGFIHCSTREQVEGVLERYYKGVPDLVLLHIDPSAIKAPLKYELAPSVNQDFPHIYGTINPEAVVEVQKIN